VPSVETADASSIHFDDVYKLFYALRAPYRQKAKFLCNETALLQLMLLKDKNGQYIWKPGLEIGKPDTILGHQIYTSTYMPAIEGEAENDAGKKVLLFGDFSYYWIADRTNRSMRRLNELYAMNDQVGFVGTQRVDGKLILPEAMKVLAMGANG
ncbi:MAG: phage major capsid protein, partial [Selenomonadaceae bacterium]|nr:phage major capsid protein [Selenomonadaceae bacterium]